MRSTIISVLIGLVIIGAVGFGGYYIVNKLKASADIESGATAVNTDLNKDGKTDALDLNMLVNAISNKSKDAKFDLNKDGKLDALDINVLINHYKK
jgi:hypothetical protein